MRCKIRIFCLAVIVIVISAASVGCQDFFKGKGIQILVGYPTGGGVDAEARLLGKYLERHLPGNPAVTVRNMPGAAGLVAANWFEQFAKPDGLQLYYGSSTNIVEQAFARDEVKYNLLNWDLIGAILRGTPVALMRPDKIDRLKSGKPLAIGSRGGDDTWNAMFLWGAEYLKWNVRWILGYGGGGEMRLAFQRGETDIYATSNLIALKELIAEGFQPFVQKGRLLSGWLVQEARGISQSAVVRRVVGRAETDRRCLASVYHDCRRRRLRPAVADSKENSAGHRQSLSRYHGAHRKGQRIRCGAGEGCRRRRRNALPCRERAGPAPVAHSFTGRQRVRPKYDEEIFEPVTSFRHLVTPPSAAALYHEDEIGKSRVKYQKLRGTSYGR